MDGRIIFDGRGLAAARLLWRRLCERRRGSDSAVIDSRYRTRAAARFKKPGRVHRPCMTHFSAATRRPRNPQIGIARPLASQTSAARRRSCLMRWRRCRANGSAAARRPLNQRARCRAELKSIRKHQTPSIGSSGINYEITGRFTGLSGGRPCRTSATFLAQVSRACLRLSTVPPPMCGVKTTFFCASRPG